MARVKSDLKTRLYKNVVKKNECIINGGFTNPRGYGMINYNGTPTLAHRLAVMLKQNDSIPPSLLVRHKCRQKACINPEHLELGTKKDNSADMRRDNTLPLGEKHASATITEKIALAIIASRGTATQEERAKKHGVTRSIIKDIDEHRRWSHLRSKEEHDAAIKRRFDDGQIRRKRQKELCTTKPYLVTKKFFDRHDKTKIVCEKEGCWIKSESRRNVYIAATMSPFSGYLHRMMWEYSHNKGERAYKKLVVRHKCHTKGCFNPDHLEIGTPQDNAHDNVGKKNDKRFNYTVEQVQKFKKLRIDGFSIKDAAFETGIHFVSARGIDAGRTWKTV
jgi:hypothetical protein